MKGNKNIFKKIVISEMVDFLEDYVTNFDDEPIYWVDLHHYVFNVDLYFINDDEAEKVLEEYGVFKAIKEVVNYKKNNFGENYTEITPMSIANMLLYINGENFIYKTLQDFEPDDDYLDLHTAAKCLTRCLKLKK